MGDSAIGQLGDSAFRGLGDWARSVPVFAIPISGSASS